MFSAIRYHLYNLKNMKNTHGGVLLKVKVFHGCFSCFLNYKNGTKSRNAPHMLCCNIGHLFIADSEIQDMAETKSIGFYLKETLALKGIMKAPDEHNCHGFGVEMEHIFVFTVMSSIKQFYNVKIYGVFLMYIT